MATTISTSAEYTVARDRVTAIVARLAPRRAINNSLLARVGHLSFTNVDILDHAI